MCVWCLLYWFYYRIASFPLSLHPRRSALPWVRQQKFRSNRVFFVCIAKLYCAYCKTSGALTIVGVQLHHFLNKHIAKPSSSVAATSALSVSSRFSHQALPTKQQTYHHRLAAQSPPRPGSHPCLRLSCPCGADVCRAGPAGLHVPSWHQASRLS